MTATACTWHTEPAFWSNKRTRLWQEPLKGKSRRPTWVGRLLRIPRGHFWVQMAVLISINFSQGVMLTAPFTLAVYMVRRFQEAKLEPGQQVDEQRVGQLTGLLAGVFSLAQFTTSFLWGVASNIAGRKPVILVGSSVSVISMLWFGLSPAYPYAIAARVFGGLFNGVLGAWKCIIGESGDTLVQGKMFGYMSLAWGLGTVLGPLIGGSLARPCERFHNFPMCGEGSLLQARPFFLPCFVGSFTVLGSGIATALLLEETLPRALRRQQIRAAIKLGYRVLRREEPAWDDDTDEDFEDEDEAGEGGEGYKHLSKPSSRPLLPLTASRTADRVGDGAAAQGSTGPGSSEVHKGRAAEDPEDQQLLESQSQLSNSAAVGNSAAATGAAQTLQPGTPSGSREKSETSSFLQRIGSFQRGSSKLARSNSIALRTQYLFRLGSRNYMRPDNSVFVHQPYADEGGRAGTVGGPDSSLTPEARALQLLRKDSRLVRQLEGDDDKEKAADNVTGSGALQLQLLEDPGTDGAVAVVSREAEASEAGAGGQVASTDGTEAVAALDSEKAARAAQNKQVFFTIAAYGFTSLLYCAVDELLPLFASAPVDQGGLGFKEADLALPIALFGVILMVYSAWVYPALQKIIGTLRLTRWGLLAAIVVCVVIPFANTALAATEKMAAAMAVLYTGMVLKAFAQCSSFTGALIMVNAAPRPEQLGSVNGIGQTVAAAVRGIGPTMGGILFAAALGLRTPGQQYLPWAIVTSAALSAWVLYGQVHLPNLK